MGGFRTKTQIELTKQTMIICRNKVKVLYFLCDIAPNFNAQFILENIDNLLTNKVYLVPPIIFLQRSKSLSNTHVRTVHCKASMWVVKFF